MNYTKKIGLFVLICFSANMSLAIDPMLGQLSPQEIDQLQQQQIEAIQAMTPAQRDSFEQEMLQAMSPEERVKYELFKNDLAQKTPEQQFEFLLKSPAEQEAYINQLYETNKSAMPALGSEPSVVAQPSTTTLVSPAEPTKEPEKPKKEIEPAKRDKALGAIAGIIEATADFLRRVDSMPEFVGKFSKWVQQGKLHNITPQETWGTLRTKIESLIDELKRIQEKDKLSKEYKYLTDFVEDESLLNNIVQLNSTLQTQKERFEKIDKKEQADEEQATERAFGLIATSKDIREVMRTVINAFIEAFEKTKIPENIKKVKEKYEPVAKKEKELEEEVRKRAFEESKRERRTEYTVVGGSAQEGYGFAPPPSYHDYLSGGYSPLGPLPDYGAPAKPLEEEKKKAEPTKAEGEKKEPEKEKKKDKVLTDIIKRFESNLIAAVEDNIQGSILENIGRHIRDDSAPDADAANNKMPNAVKKIKAAANTLRSFKSKVEKSGKGVSNEYTNQINDVYEEFRKPLDNLYNQITLARSSKNAASQEKQKAFFGGSTTLTDLQNAIQELRSAHTGSAFNPEVTPRESMSSAATAKKEAAEKKPEKSEKELAKERKMEAPVDRIIEKFERNIKTAFEQEISGKLEKIKEHMMSTDAPDKAALERLPLAINAINEALKNLANLTPNLKKLSQEKQQEKRESIQYMVDENQATINKLYTDLQWIEENENKIDAPKKQAFLGEIPAEPEKEAAEEQERPTLYDLKEAIDNLRKSIKEL